MVTMSEPAAGSALDWGVGHYERTAEMLLPAAQVLVDVAALQKGERVLDVGTGTGNVALLAAAAGAHVTAVDPSERLLRVASAAARQRGLDVTCEAGDAAALPVPDASTDCMLSNFGVVFAPDPGAAAAEIARVLTPGGRAAFTAWVPGGAIGALAATAQELVRAAVGAPPAPPRFPWHEAAEVAGLFSPPGLTVAVALHHDIVFTAPSPQAYLDAELANHPLAVAAFDVLRQRGQAGPARDRLLEILTDRNEDAAGFRCTSRYVVLVARRG
jgi:SAM-dependent methyltransferase